MNINLFFAIIFNNRELLINLIILKDKDKLKILKNINKIIYFFSINSKKGFYFKKCHFFINLNHYTKIRMNKCKFIRNVMLDIKINIKENINFFVSN